MSEENDYNKELFSYFKGFEIKQILEMARTALELQSVNRMLERKLFMLKDKLLKSRIKAEERMKYDMDREITVRTINEMLEMISEE